MIDRKRKKIAAGLGKKEKQQKVSGRKKALLCGVIVVSALLLGGCEMGGATGNKTTQGIQALEDENYQLAQTLFEDAAKEGEQQMLAYRGLGIAYMGQAQYEQAEEAFETALEYADEKMPENTLDVSLYLATVQYKMEEYEKTVATCTDILETVEGGNAQAYFLRGASNLKEGFEEDARADFDAAVALEPEDYDLYLNIYEAYRSVNLSGIGGEYLQSALHISGEDTEHYYNRGRIYYYLEDYDSAQSQLIGPVESKYEPAMLLIAKVYLAQNDTEHAQAVYQQLLQASGATTQVMNGLALCEMQLGNYDTALDYISQGLALDGTSGKQELYFNEIVVYERKLDFETAKAKAQEYVTKYPADEAGQKELTFLKTR